MPPAQQGVEPSDSTAQLFHGLRRAVLARYQPRKDRQTSPLNDVIVIAPAEPHAAVFDDQQPPPLGAVFRIDLLQPHHAVRDALDLEVAIRTGQIIQQDHGAVAAREELL